VGITMLGHLRNQRRKRLARNTVILLGIAMPSIVIDTLLHEAVSMHFYPLAYCAAGLIFTYHMVKYSLIHPQEIRHHQLPPSAVADGVGENLAEPPPVDLKRESKPADRFLSDELYQRYNLSPREQEVLPLLVQGASNKELSERLFISVNTVKTHLRNIYAKFEVKNRYELLALLKHGDEDLIPRSDSGKDA
jgi:DNA-binding CsgD family transcriptional regulator